MVITRDVKEEIETSVSHALSKYLKSESFIKTLVQNVSDAVIKTIEQKLLNIENIVGEIQADFITHKTETENKIKKLEKTIKDINSEKNTIEETLDKIDQASRVKCLRIFGMNEKQQENIREEIVKLFNDKMSLILADEDIEICYRVGRQEGKKSRGIYLKLKNVISKQNIYANKKLLKGTGIVIKEDLTASRVNILNNASEKVGHKNVWTYYGKIYVNFNGKIYILTNKRDLENLLN